MHAMMCMNDAKCPCYFLASRIHQSFTKTLIEMNCLSYDLWEIHRCYYTTSVVYEYGADAFFREKVTGQSYFLQ